MATKALHLVEKELYEKRMMRIASARLPNPSQIRQIIFSKDHGLPQSEVSKYVVKLLEAAQLDSVRVPEKKPPKVIEVRPAESDLESTPLMSS